MPSENGIPAEDVAEQRLLIPQLTEGMARQAAEFPGLRRRQLRIFRWIDRLKECGKRFLAPHLDCLEQYPARPLAVPRYYRKLPSLLSPPRISIVTPSFNHADYLEHTLKSVLDQNYPNLEYIVQDGASTDETVSILERYQARLACWRSEPDRGQSSALNLGFRRATGDILAYLNSDDLLLPGSLHHVAHYFSTHLEVDVIYGHRIIIDTDNSEVGRWVLPPHNDDVLAWVDFVPQETLFWRRAIWDKIGASIDESFQFAMDWDLLLRFRDAGAGFVRLPRFLGAFLLHDLQKTKTQLSGVGAREMDRLRQRTFGRRVSDLEIRDHVRPFLRRHVLFRNLYLLGFLGC